MTLQQRIDQKINEIAPSLELIPGVVIIHNLSPPTVIFMTNIGLNLLKITLKELQTMGLEYYPRFFNPEDAADYVPKVMGLLERNNDEETVSYFQQVKAADEKNWTWYVSGTRIFMRNDGGMPILTITVAMPIDAKHYFLAKMERLLLENDFLRKNQHLFAGLTKREKQILAIMAKDKTSQMIGKELFLSEDTIKTHRRNIKKKLGTQNQYDIMRFAQSFDLL